VGKTTLLKALSESTNTADTPRRYVTLDNPTLLALAGDEPALFLQRFTPPVLIDEIQYAPGLLPLIKEMVDGTGDKGMVWLTGSQPFHLMKNVVESLAGRVAVMQLQGLSASEGMGHGNLVRPFLPGNAAHAKALPPQAKSPLQWGFDSIWRGGFPAVQSDDIGTRNLFYASYLQTYLQTYLQRDVRDLAQVGDLLAFTRFVRSAAARTAQLVNLADMARDVGIAPNTAKQWLSVLQASGLVFLLEPYHTNVSKRMVKAPKVYF
jgi:predicted AAA+ superfamily ATPase